VFARARSFLYYSVQNSADGSSHFSDGERDMAIGRPRTFDADAALDEALQVFWRKGFEGASLDDLTEAMGINRPSLYAAFGNKEQLFRRALERYEALQASRIRDALSEPSVHAAMEKLLRGNIEMATDPRNPPGCFIVQGARACGDAADQLKSEMGERRAMFTALLRKRFAEAIAANELPMTASADDLAKYVATVSHGLAVQAAGGMPRAQLLRVAKIALQGLPANGRRRTAVKNRT
jgi:AcrR family transcriptional regulator